MRIAPDVNPVIVTNCAAFLPIPRVLADIPQGEKHAFFAPLSPTHSIQYTRSHTSRPGPVTLPISFVTPNPSKPDFFAVTYRATQCHKSLIASLSQISFSFHVHI